MRLLHVTHQYRPAIGGAEKYITDLSEELARRGHQVDVFTSRSLDYHTWRSELPRFERLEGVNVYRFSSLVRTERVWRALAYGFAGYWRTRARRYEPFIFYGNGPICPGMFVAIMRRAHQYDLLHVNNLHYSHAWIAYIAARIRHLPIVITPHVHAEQPATYDVGYLRTILRNSHAILADTYAEKQYLDQLGLNPEIVVGGVGLRQEQFPSLGQHEGRRRFGLPEDGFVILFLGRKTEYKGLEMALDAFVALRQTRSDVYFLAIGPETEFSQALWSRYSSVEGLVIRGTVIDEERLAALSACDVLVMPSVEEAFGIVYLEAWAYRKPVIGANIASVASIITDGVNGFLVEPYRVEPLVKCLTHLLEHPELAKRMGESGYKRLIQRYTVERIADIVEGTYARVLRRQHSLAYRHT